MGVALGRTKGRVSGHASGQGQVKISPVDCKALVSCPIFSLPDLQPSPSSCQACPCYWLTLPFLCAVFFNGASDEPQLPPCLALVLARCCSDSLIQPAGLCQSLGAVLVPPMLLQNFPSWSPFLNFSFAACKLSLP